MSLPRTACCGTPLILARCWTSSRTSLGWSGMYVRNNLQAHGETVEDQVTGIAMQALDELQD
jgi:hypothetical protein